MVTNVAERQPVEARAAYDEYQESKAVLIDVRGFDEFAAGHAEGAVCIPLPDLDKRASELPSDKHICVMCQTGGRSAMAAERLAEFGFSGVRDIQGGYAAWRAAGLPSVIGHGIIPLEQQVRGIAGFLVFASTVGALFGAKKLLAVPVFVGFMLLLSGVTGLCPMIAILRRMPWNRSHTVGDKQ